MGYTSGKSKLRVNEKGARKNRRYFRMKAKRITALLAAAAMAVSLMTDAHREAAKQTIRQMKLIKEDGGIV